MFRTLCSAALLVLPLCFNGQSICQIQGAGSASPYIGQQVSTEGVVTALFTGSGSLNGYFLEQPDCDGDDATSNGIFVYDPTPNGVAVGLRLSVSATVTEFNGVTELTGPNTQVLGPGSVTPTDVDLPLGSFDQWERYEGMLLRFPGTMVVTENGGLFQYGELVFAPERLVIPTDHLDPNDVVASGTTFTGIGNVTAISDAYDLIERSRVVFDDGRTSTYPSPTPHLDAAGTLRTGSTVSGLSGVLHYSYGAYRLEPVGTIALAPAERPAVPAVGNALRAASLNVLNYFTTIGEWGAQNASELVRQRSKLLAAIVAMDPDVLALCEVENSDAAWMDLLDVLNAQVGANTYEAVEEDGFGFGTRSVIFYKQAILEPITPLYSLNTGLFQRPHLTQGFRAISSGGQFLFSTVHLRSKLCDNATGGNLDQGDGQGCYNGMRRAQSEALAAHWSGLRSQSGIAAQLIMGDFNAYTEEDPLDVLRASGLLDLILPSDHSYSYQGLTGALDHAFGTQAMADVVLGGAAWHINSDEPSALDYSDTNISRYQPNAFRSSDHDPIIVGFAGSGLPVALEELGVHSGIQFTLSERIGTWRTEAFPEVMDLVVVDGRGAQVFSSKSWGVSQLDFSASASGVYLWRATKATSGELVGVGRFVLP